MKRIYHPYWLWEEFQNGFYESYSKKDFDIKKEKIVELFSCSEKTSHFMRRVINEFPYSCEHNFTNTSMNRIAFLGQCAALLYCNSPSELTMKSWSFVPEKFQNQANLIAEEIINNYVENLSTK